MPRTAASRARALAVTRTAAKGIDLLIVIVGGAILPTVAGPLLGFVYSLCADGLPFEGFRGQSIGKRLLGLRVLHRPGGEPAGLKDSAIRNAPVGVAMFFAIIPVWGWIILILVGVPLLAIEVYLLFRVENGHRLGDVMADTEVAETDPERAGRGIGRRK